MSWFQKPLGMPSSSKKTTFRQRTSHPHKVRWRLPRQVPHVRENSALNALHGWPTPSSSAFLKPPWNHFSTSANDKSELCRSLAWSFESQSRLRTYLAYKPIPGVPNQIDMSPGTWPAWFEHPRWSSVARRDVCAVHNFRRKIHLTRKRLQVCFCGNDGITPQGRQPFLFRCNSL